MNESKQHKPPRGPEIKLTDEQKRILQAAADRVGLTLTAYIRLAALEKAQAENSGK